MSRKASDFCRIFHAESSNAKSLIVYRWLKAEGLRYQMSTHESQHSPVEAASDALDFMQEIKKKVSETDHEKLCFQYGLNPCLLHLSLKINFGDERGKDSTQDGLLLQ